MSNSPSLPHALPTDTEQSLQPPVFNLTVLIKHLEDGRLVARAANLELAEIESSTVREALSATVSAAKSMIEAKRLESKGIPWIDPPRTPLESESRFVVPLHL